MRPILLVILVATFAGTPIYGAPHEKSCRELTAELRAEIKSVAAMMVDQARLSTDSTQDFLRIAIEEEVQKKREELIRQGILPSELDKRLTHEVAELLGKKASQPPKDPAKPALRLSEADGEKIGWVRQGLQKLRERLAEGETDLSDIMSDYQEIHRGLVYYGRFAAELKSETADIAPLLQEVPQALRSLHRQGIFATGFQDPELVREELAVAGTKPDFSLVYQLVGKEARAFDELFIEIVENYPSVMDSRDDVIKWSQYLVAFEKPELLRAMFQSMLQSIIGKPPKEFLKHWVMPVVKYAEDENQPDAITTLMQLGLTVEEQPGALVMQAAQKGEDEVLAKYLQAGLTVPSTFHWDDLAQRNLIWKFTKIPPRWVFGTERFQVGDEKLSKEEFIKIMKSGVSDNPALQKYLRTWQLLKGHFTSNPGTPSSSPSP